MKNKAKKYTSPLIQKILKSIPLKTRVFTILQMEDYDNWENGEYKGNNKRLIKLTKWILEDVFQWIKDGKSGGEDIDLTKYEK